MFLLMTYSEEEQEKFTTIFKQHYKALVVRAYQILGSYQYAEDAVEETFIRALKNLHKISEIESARTAHFLLRTVERVAKTMYRKRQKVVTVDIDSYEPEPKCEDPTWDIFDSEEMVKALEKIIKTMPQSDRDLLTYKMLYQWSYAEIADAMDISVKNVSVRLTRIRAKIMKEYLKEKEGRR